MSPDRWSGGEAAPLGPAPPRNQRSLTKQTHQLAVGHPLASLGHDTKLVQPIARLIAAMMFRVTLVGSRRQHPGLPEARRSRCRLTVRRDQRYGDLSSRLIRCGQISKVSLERR